MGAIISYMLHKSGWGRTAMEEAHGANFSGRTAIITGGASGIGLETARALAMAGGRVVIACRDVEAGRGAAKAVAGMRGVRGTLDVKHLDLASFRSIRAFADEVLAEKDARIDVLVLNAGVMNLSLEHTREGFESHWGVNYLGHVHLLQLLLPAMQAQDVPSRVVAVTCAAHRAKLDLRDPGYARRKYVWTSAYASSKKALWYYAKEMATRTRRGRVAILTVDPGRTATGLTRRLGPIEDLLLYLQNVFVKTVPQGAASVVHACLAERLRGKSGAYIKNCRVHGKGAGTARQRERLRAETDAAIAGAALDSWREVDVYGQAVGRVLSRGLSPLLELVGLKQGKGKRV